MGAILAAISALGNLFNSLMGYLRDKQLTDGAVAVRTAEVQAKVIADEKVASDIRDTVREHAAADLDSLRQPDPDSRD